MANLTAVSGLVSLPSTLSTWTRVSEGVPPPGAVGTVYLGTVYECTVTGFVGVPYRLNSPTPSF